MNGKMLAVGMTVGLCLSALGRPGPMPHPGSHPGYQPMPHRPSVHITPPPMPYRPPVYHHKSPATVYPRPFYPPAPLHGPRLLPPPPPPVRTPAWTAIDLTSVFLAPHYLQQQVWIEGHYETQIVNGICTQVWVPGRWVIVR